MLAYRQKYLEQFQKKETNKRFLQYQEGVSDFLMKYKIKVKFLQKGQQKQRVNDPGRNILAQW